MNSLFSVSSGREFRLQWAGSVRTTASNPAVDQRRRVLRRDRRAARLQRRNFRHRFPDLGRSGRARRRHQPRRQKGDPDRRGSERARPHQHFSQAGIGQHCWRRSHGKAKS